MQAHAHTLRKARVSMPDHVYHLTATTLKREPIFADFKNARTLIRCMMYLQAQAQVHSIAYVVMPDHFHWLIQLKNESTLSRVMKSVKGYSAKQMSRAIWQAGYHDHGVRAEHDLRHIARYIVANPIRANLVQTVGEYPHWDTSYL
jgi:putative transposase